DGVTGLSPYSNCWARAAISPRRQVHWAFVVTGVPSKNVKGSGRKGSVGRDAKEGVGGGAHAPSPLPRCVTDTVREVTPVPETVMVAVRTEVPVLAWAVAVTDPLFEPEAGLSVSQG